MPPRQPPARKRTTSSGSPPGRGRLRTSTLDEPVYPESDETGGQKLVCIAGPKAGSEFPLLDEEVVIGRATDATISIPDTSVSRRHLMLRRLPSGWSASDLGSGNGTLLNGEPLSEETPLHNGDVLSCGDTELSFVDESNVTNRRPVPTRRPPTGADLPARRGGEGRPRVARSRHKGPDPAAQRRRRRMVIYFLLFVVLCGGLFAGLKHRDQGAERARAAREQKERARRDQIGKVFQEAKNLVRAGKWSQAQGKFEEVKQQEPAFPGVGDYLERATKEIPNEQSLNEAEAALAEGKVGPAAEALAKVSEDTQQFERLRQLKSSLDDKLRSRLEDARQLMLEAPKVSTDQDTSKYDEVVAITDDVLQAHPDNRDAKVMNEQAKEAIAILTKPKVRRPPPPARPWEEAADLFVDGDMNGAFEAARACSGKFSRCRTMLGQMNEFKGYYAKLEDLDGRGLSALLTLDSKITGRKGPSKMARRAGTRAATIFYKSATAAKAAGQWARALEYTLKALKAAPGHAGAQAILTDLRQKAKDVYLLGYSLKDSSPDEAALKFKEAMQMAPPGDETYKKAKHWLNELGL